MKKRIDFSARRSPAGVERLKHNGITALNAAKALGDSVPAVAAHHDDGVVQPAGYTRPHKASHGVVLDEIFVERLEPKCVTVKTKTIL
jgi:hypothetical protein